MNNFFLLALLSLLILRLLLLLLLLFISLWRRTSNRMNNSTYLSIFITKTDEVFVNQRPFSASNLLPQHASKQVFSHQTTLLSPFSMASLVLIIFSLWQNYIGLKVKHYSHSKMPHANVVVEVLCKRSFLKVCVSLTKDHSSVYVDRKLYTLNMNFQ